MEQAFFERITEKVGRAGIRRQESGGRHQAAGGIKK
jgi:hypothetical protein